VIANLETEARKAQHASADAHERLRELDVTVAAEQAARARAEEELRAITQTKTFRVAATLGGAYGRIRGIARRRS
jgi:hypothetical protein